MQTSKSVKVQLFVNSWGSFSRETLQCRRVQAIFAQYQEVLPVAVADINTDMVQAYQGVSASEFTFSRGQLAEKLQLVRSSEDQIRLPQAFLVVTGLVKGKETEVERLFLGHCDAIQFLEDSGLLHQILLGSACPHFRCFESRVYYSFSNQQRQNSHKAVEVCNQCSSEPKPITVIANVFNSSDTSAHDICVFFENNKISFSTVDPYNTHLSWQKKLIEKHLSITKAVQEKYTVPRVFIHGIEVTLEQVLNLAQKEGLLQSVLSKSRCLTCLGKLKIAAKGQCAKCLPPQKNSVLLRSAKSPTPKIQPIYRQVLAGQSPKYKGHSKIGSGVLSSKENSPAKKLSLKEEVDLSVINESILNELDQSSFYHETNLIENEHCNYKKPSVSKKRETFHCKAVTQMRPVSGNRRSIFDI